MLHPKRDTAANALRRGRFSTANASYFVTVCLTPRTPILTSTIASAILAEIHAMHADASWILRCATIMPDHVHLFFTLGERLTLSQSIARLKSRTRLLFDPPVRWPQNFYDHKLRPADSAEAVIRYIFQNPHRANLLQPPATWPYFHCHPDDWSWFAPLTDTGLPFPEWLQ